MFVKDFDGNGFAEQIVACYNQGSSYPLALRDDLIRALPSLESRFPDYKSYARLRVSDIFSAAELEGAIEKSAYTFASSLVRHNADGSFTLVPLPREAQVAPVYGILVEDVDGNGTSDLVMAGNFDGVQPEIGRISASYGLILRGDGRGGFMPVRTVESGFLVPGQSRDIQRVRTSHGRRYLVARNNDRPLVFQRSSQ